MIVYNITEPDNSYITKREKFIVNNIFPIAIRNVSDDKYIIIFIGYQDNDEKYVYFQTLLSVESMFEKTYLDNFPINIKNNKDGKLKELLSKITNDNIFATGFNFSEDSEHFGYFKVCAVHAINNNSASVLDLYVGLDTFTKIQLYIDNIINMNTNNIGLIFVDDKLKNLELVNIETIEYTCTKLEKINDLSIYTSHYVMNCGPSTFKLNYSSFSEKNKLLRNQLNSDLYNTFYSNDIIIRNEDMFIFNNNLYIVYKAKSNILVEESKRITKTYLLKLSKSIYEKTNLINNDNIFVMEE